MGNTGNEIVKEHGRVVVDIEIHHPRNRKMITINADAGLGRDQEQEVVVVIEITEGNALGHTRHERNELHRLMRRKEKSRRKKSNLSEWAMSRRGHRQYRRMDLINP